MVDSAAVAAILARHRRNVTGTWPTLDSDSETESDNEGGTFMPYPLPPRPVHTPTHTAEEMEQVRNRMIADWPSIRDHFLEGYHLFQMKKDMEKYPEPDK